MVRLLRLLRGYVVFAVTGSCPERFINICTYNGVNVWGVKSKEGVVTCCTLAANYRIIRLLSRRCSCKIRVKRKRGLTFVVHRNKKRVGLVIGLVCFFAIMKLLSSFLWYIDYQGLQTVSEFHAAEIMRSTGFYEGAFANFESLKNIQTKAMIEFGNTSWMTVNVDGSVGEVKITEAVEKGKIFDNSSPCNIKADCEAQIIRVDVFSGMANVQSGDAVVGGNLLISGVVENEQGGLSLVHADGVVWAKTTRNESFSYPKNYRYAAVSDEPVVRRSCRIFNMVLPLTFKSQNNGQGNVYCLDETRVMFRDGVASLSLITESSYAYEMSEVVMDKNLAQKQFEADRILYELFNYSNRSIKNHTVKESEDGDSFFFDVVYDCEEDIGLKSDILIDDRGFDIDNASLQSDTDSEGE
ncbi:MAG: sporulation protein YqfD [Lachnospiraceae bacterium]|nr:sporulation protein YqfD [Lachnospiraceae bacterium]